MRATCRWSVGALVGGLGIGLIALTVPQAVADATPSPGSKPASGKQLSVRVFAAGTPTMSQPDDITQLGRDIFVAWQNGVGPAGQPSAAGATTSTVVEYRPSGEVIHHWALAGHVDGLSADPGMEAVIATANEDGNSSLFTIEPSSPAGQQVTHYNYNVNPLPHGGGTDAISVYRGQILISASAPTVSDGPAVYRVRLKRGEAMVQPVFFDDSSAVVANAGATERASATLALTDPDSNEVVPSASPSFAHDFVLNSQGDEEQVYVDGANGPRPHLSLLQLSQSVDDTAWVTKRNGTLYVTDGADGEVFAVTGGFRLGEALVAVTPSDANTPVNEPNYLGQLDMFSGAIRPVLTSIQAKGLLFVG